VLSRGHGDYACVLTSGPASHVVRADHVVLALPFTRLREVDLRGIDLLPRQRSAAAAALSHPRGAAGF
jgi:hypothetical protein